MWSRVKKQENKYLIKSRLGGETFKYSQPKPEDIERIHYQNNGTKLPHYNLLLYIQVLAGNHVDNCTGLRKNGIPHIINVIR